MKTRGDTDALQHFLSHGVENESAILHFLRWWHYVYSIPQEPHFHNVDNGTTLYAGLSLSGPMQNDIFLSKLVIAHERSAEVDAAVVLLSVGDLIFQVFSIGFH